MNACPRSLSPKNLCYRYAKCQGNIEQGFAAQRFHVKKLQLWKMALIYEFAPQHLQDQ